MEGRKLTFRRTESAGGGEIIYIDISPITASGEKGEKRLYHGKQGRVGSALRKRSSLPS